MAEIDSLRPFKAGDEILPQAELGERFYAVASGRVKMLRAMPNGRQVVLASQRMLEMQRQLSAWTARVECIALEAHRGGVSTAEAEAAIDRAVDSQVELQAPRPRALGGREKLAGICGHLARRRTPSPRPRYNSRTI